MIAYDLDMLKKLKEEGVSITSWQEECLKLNKIRRKYLPNVLKFETWLDFEVNIGWLNFDGFLFILRSQVVDCELCEGTGFGFEAMKEFRRQLKFFDYGGISEKEYKELLKRRLVTRPFRKYRLATYSERKKILGESALKKLIFWRFLKRGEIGKCQICGGAGKVDLLDSVQFSVEFYLKDTLYLIENIAQKDCAKIKQLCKDTGLL